jgi:hypothetical protein
MKRYIVITLMFFLLISCNEEKKATTGNNGPPEPVIEETINYNHLGAESSPYLLQHADNPVNWYPYSDEALEKAMAKDKLIFLSIGYSTCHWCHIR